MLTRRKFIKNSSLALAGIGLIKNTSAGPINGSTLKKNEPVYVNGKVVDNQGGMKDISVSDGINVVKTDQNGDFSLITDNSQKFIFISLPSGYKIPKNSTGTANFYKVLSQSDSKNVNIEFKLEKTDTDDNEHYFLLLADPQTLDMEDIEKLHSETLPDIRETVSGINNSNIFGVSCGDIMYDKLELYPEYEKAVIGSGIPFFQVLGNHDLELLAATDEESSNTFEEYFGPRYYSFNKGKIHYVVLDNVFWYGSGYLGYLDKKQLDWLRSDLQNVEKGSTVVIFNHIPVYCEIHKRHGSENPRNSVVVTNRKELYEILEPYKSYILCGHTHESEYLLDGNSEIHIGGAVCGAWWTGPVCRDGTPKGYTVYRADGDEISWNYKSVGEDLSYQMRIYDRGSIKDYRDHIAVNVWNADEYWDVRWYEDGTGKGKMERIIAKDPLALSLYEGRDKPEKHKWVEPYNTNHIFIAKPSVNAKVVRIIAKDRWGNTYSDEINLD